MTNKDIAEKLLKKITQNPKNALAFYKQNGDSLTEFAAKYVNIPYGQLFDFQNCQFYRTLDNFMISLNMGVVDNPLKLKSAIQDATQKINNGNGFVNKQQELMSMSSLSGISSLSTSSVKKPKKINEQFQKLHKSQMSQKSLKSQKQVQPSQKKNQMSQKSLKSQKQIQPSAKKQSSMMKKNPGAYNQQKQPIKKNQKQTKPKKQIQIQIQKQIQIQTQIPGKDVQVIVSYLSAKFNIQYTHNNRQLRKEIIDYVQNYLDNNLIQVRNGIALMSKISGQDYQKNKECGNYYFYPFFDCVRFQIKRVDKKQWTTSCRVKGKVQIIFKQIKQQKQWSIIGSLTQHDKIQKLITSICQKNQQSLKTQKAYIKIFVEQQSIKIVKDLFHWEKENFQKLKLKINFTYQIMEVVQKIKYESGNILNQKRRKIKQQKANCIKIANSHKVLRYAVFKTKGNQQLSKLSMVNLQNMERAVAIVKKEIINDQLLNQLQEYFYQFTHVPRPGEKSVGFSRGLVLFGPPGTGKTELTQALPNLIGFHLISTGLSAADFMKSLVGQSSRMILNLVNRANLSPHLLCSVAIDEVDGLVPDRKDKDQKNKGQGISMLLSVIGGIKDVPNLLYFTSTNHLKKIDQAIRRRLSGQFQVGRPNPEARKKVILDDLTFLEKDPDMLNYLIKVTSNFTGAALKRLNAALLMKISRKRGQKLPQILTKLQVTQGATQIAKQFSITLGMSTFPQIYANKTNKKYIFSMKFLKNISRRLMLITQNQNGFQISYANQMQKYITHNDRKKLSKYYEVFKDTLNIQDKEDINFSGFIQWVYKSLKDPQVIICKNLQKLRDALHDSYKLPTLVIVKQLSEKQDKYGGKMLGQIVQKQKFNNNLYLFYYHANHAVIQNCYKLLGWEEIKQHPYSGRILIELNDQPRMAFELSTPQDDQTKFSFRHFMKTQNQNSVNDVLPELIQFFTQRQVSYILLIQYQLMLQNAAYDEQKMLQIIEQKMAEAMNYNKVAVIINVDSLIVLNQSASDSSMGRSTSYSVADQNMYRLLLNYMRQFAMITKKPGSKKVNNKKQFQVAQSVLRYAQKLSSQQKQKIKTQQKQKWIAVIANNPELVKLIKKDLRWPCTPEEIKQLKKEQQKKKQKKCARCYTKYTQQQNQKQRKCMGHPGPLIDLRMNTLDQEITVRQAKMQQMKYKNTKKANQKQNQKMENLYVFACCLKGVNQPGQNAYRHITKEQLGGFEDELEVQRQERMEQWQESVDNL